jgi:hypothetical protein
MTYRGDAGVTGLNGNILHSSQSQRHDAKWDVLRFAHNLRFVQ